MIDQTLFAVATTDSKPVHTGSMFGVDEEGITLVSVDGLPPGPAPGKGENRPADEVHRPGKTLSPGSQAWG